LQFLSRIGKIRCHPATTTLAMSTPTKRQLTVQLSDVEMDALESLANQRAFTKVAVLRQALRLYQTVDTRQQRGEKLFFENERNKEKAELMLL
jgi:hypothetical protein